MANPNEISVDLRLKLEKLKQDAQEAGKVMRDIPDKAVERNLNRSGSYTDKEGNQRTRSLKPTSIMQEDLRAKVEARRKAAAIEAAYDAQDLKQQVQAAGRRNKARDLWRQRDESKEAETLKAQIEAATRSNRARSLLRERDEARQSRAAATAKNAAEDLVKFNRNIGFGALPIMNPTSAIGNFASARQSYKAFSTTSTGAAMQSKMGLPAGAAGAIAASGIVTATLIALGLALKGLAKMVELTAESFERASRFYAKQLQSGGMAQKFVIQRSLLAQVMGVSENEVMQYGMAIGTLNEKIANSTAIFAQTNSTLTATSWNIKAAEISFEALGASFAVIFAPAVSEFANLTRSIVDFVANSEALHNGLYIVEGLFMGIEFVLKLVAAATAVVVLGFDELISNLKALYLNINNLLASMHVPGFKTDKSDPYAGVRKEEQDILNMLKGTGGKEGAPGIPTSTKRMPSSAWEKMGLVIGNAGTNDHAKKTAQNTSKLVQQNERLINLLSMPRSGSMGILQIPSGAQP